MWQTYFQPTSLAEALDLLQHYGEQARVIAGGTDVLVQLQRGIKPTQTLIDLTALHFQYPQTDRRKSKNFVPLPAMPDMGHYTGNIQKRSSYFALGALTTHNDVI